MLDKSKIATAVALLLGGALTCTSQQIRPGVWAGTEVQPLPLPTAGFQAYMVGELHGIEENAQFELKYLTLLNEVSGLRDVAIDQLSASAPRFWTESGISTLDCARISASAFILSTLTRQPPPFVSIWSNSNNRSPVQKR